MRVRGRAPVRPAWAASSASETFARRPAGGLPSFVGPTPASDADAAGSPAAGAGGFGGTAVAGFARALERSGRLERSRRGRLRRARSTGGGGGGAGRAAGFGLTGLGYRFRSRLRIRIGWRRRGGVATDVVVGAVGISSGEALATARRGRERERTEGREDERRQIPHSAGAAGRRRLRVSSFSSPVRASRPKTADDSWCVVTVEHGGDRIGPDRNPSGPRRAESTLELRSPLLDSRKDRIELALWLGRLFHAAASRARSTRRGTGPDHGRSRSAAALAHLVRRPLGLDALGGQLLNVESRSSTVSATWP